jgi:hypothetical protein
MDYRRERLIQRSQQFRYLELIANRLRDFKDDLCSFLWHVVEPPRSPKFFAARGVRTSIGNVRPNLRMKNCLIPAAFDTDHVLPSPP